jgi:hypothetical protein
VSKVKNIVKFDTINTMRRLLQSKNFRIWLAIVGSATLIIGAAYSMVQQSTRLAADDLPLATATAVKDQLENGANPADVVTPRPINLRSNTNVFVIVVDSSRHVLASSATVDGQTPLPPQGVFDYTDQHGTDHFTWQPVAHVRLATRVMAYGQAPNNGFVIAGQSLAQTENRIDIYTELALAAWLAMLAWTYLVLLMPSRVLSRQAK